MFASFVTLILLVSASSSSANSFRENFSEGLSPERWEVSTWTAPRSSPLNQASFSASHVQVKDGVLQLKLTQRRNADGTITSIGGEVKSRREFGYGTFEFELKASTVSGSVTGAYVYAAKSETEIDIEVDGSKPHLTQTSTWIHEDKPYENFKVPSKHGRFHKYKITWMPQKVTFYEDDRLIATHTRVVPAKPGAFMFNHWGTDSKYWGGTATVGVDRYIYVKNFSFTPK